MKDFIFNLYDCLASGILFTGMYGLAAILLYYLLRLVRHGTRLVYKGKSVLVISIMIVISIYVGGTKPIKAIIIWDEGLHDAGTIVSSNDLRTITFKWTYENWIPNIATVDIKAYDIHAVNENPNADIGFYVCNGVPITDMSAIILMETDATNYCYYVSQSYIPDAPVVTNGVYHIHAVGTNNVWVPIGLKIFEDSRIISPHKGDNNEQ